MLFAELSAEAWGVIVTAGLAGIGSIVLGVATLYLGHKRELRAEVREQAKLERDLAAVHEVKGVKRTLEEDTVKRESFAKERDAKLDEVKALSEHSVKQNEVLVKQTDGMQTALSKAIADGSFDAGRLNQMDRDKIKKEVEKAVIEDLNGHGSKLEKIETTTEEIKADTKVLVNEIAADVKDVKDRMPEKQ